jgi:hypothetical protein
MTASEKKVKSDKELSVELFAGLLALYHNVETYHSTGGPQNGGCF